MAVRAYWKGSLKLSLVSCPVLLYPASTSVEKTRFHMIELASHILDTKAAHFDPSKFKDEYEDALKTLVRRKAAGKPVKAAEREEKPDNVISLMDALQQSLKGKASAKRSAHSRARRATHRPTKKAHRSAARARKAS
jgi:non-homologous end joining protein Ku